jgi:hypothetical protein
LGYSGIDDGISSSESHLKSRTEKGDEGELTGWFTGGGKVVL